MLIRESGLQDAVVIAKVHVATWRAAYAGIVPEAYLARLSIEDRIQFFRSFLGNPESQGFMFVAEDESGNVVGFIAAGPERTGNRAYPGEIYGLYVIPECQRQGVGFRLLLAAVEELSRREMPSMMLWVLADNPCRAFYESLGGIEIRRRQLNFDGAQLDEVAYGWPDLKRLMLVD